MTEILVPQTTIHAAGLDSDEGAALRRSDQTAAGAAALPPLDWEHMGRFPVPWRQPGKALAWLATLSFGGVCLFAVLTLAAVFPGGNFFALGFLLDVEGEIIKGGKLRLALPVLPAARLGAIALGLCLGIVPLWLLADVASDARWVSPGGTAAWLLTGALAAAATLVATYLCLALARGGSLGCFFRPIKNVRWLREHFRAGGYWTNAYVRLQEFVAVWRIPQRVWRGAIAFAGSVIWLAAPMALFTVVQVREAPAWQKIIMLAGGACVALVLSWLPFLQARFAAENRWRAMFEVRAVRELFRHAPLSWMLAIVCTYALSIPFYFYLLHIKMRLPPYEALGDVMLVILLTTYPARVFVAWAYRRATRRPVARAPWRWISRVLLVAALGAFVFLLFITQPLGDNGRRALFEHHAVVIPLPL